MSEVSSLDSMLNGSADEQLQAQIFSHAMALKQKKMQREKKLLQRKQTSRKQLLYSMAVMALGVILAFVLGRLLTLYGEITAQNMVIRAKIDSLRQELDVQRQWMETANEFFTETRTQLHKMSDESRDSSETLRHNKNKLLAQTDAILQVSTELSKLRENLKTIVAEGGILFTVRSQVKGMSEFLRKQTWFAQPRGDQGYPRLD